MLQRGPQDSLTHSDSNPRTALAATWLAPRNYTGSVILAASVVQDFATYWVNMQTDPVLISPAHKAEQEPLAEPEPKPDVKPKAAKPPAEQE